MTNLIQRTVTAVILIPLFLALVHWGGRGGLLVPGLLVCFLAQQELYRMFPDVWRRFPSRAALLAGALIVGGFGLMATGRMSPDSFLALLALLLTALFSVCVLSGDEKDMTGGFPLVLTGAVYIPLGVGMILLLRGLPGGEGLVFYLFGLTWIVDIMGFIVGKTIGRVKLSPLLSPNKTWEGAIAGVVGGLVWGVSTRGFLMPAIPLVDVIVISVAVSAWGQMGDLSESAFKRAAGVKDSGGIIPGHGGVLDRIDSLLFNSVALYAFLSIFEGYSSRVWL